MNQQDEERDFYHSSQWDVVRALQPLGGQEPLIERERYTKWVVVAHVNRYCRFTDAALGSETHHISSHETEAEAIEACNKEYSDSDIYFQVLPPKYLVEHIGYAFDPYQLSDIPF